ncbi:methylenetetrahydrofolate--tRNA-(uracil(54)-C(5))-methyltransferase (FADH(2)-oxidizing) TrmFO [Thermodesulfobacterium sp.]|jgi:methylenetetrahydrofolate--tRNA-(uracil-5-)-methyltransferase|uniref:methylenetetrahydrofolate--tRNA-(uracil(54)- C(5))-methyltransferase (FADH(2)-oxidizing) TrmFO n=1 Tax=Thermodesulfobacterium sp. TaxID=1965289 RepID=UPI00074880C9|nr:methylenetetrahydrofolate--tRNA-(uracil(54)-C(5))-methyltransferase (FADH(2)-oxidizing) TrmFO [Thermodesulfobacterium sp.]KUJ97125.1 MAG: Methylenetetrahydrofolate--tRNA-(uracil-5-)-methyltransferase TrmFO [Thermodesulfobacterium sp. 37_54]MBZ4682050.1 gid [Thermodesulfobacterium sp.]HCP10183.1 methylenetetrahydrofolate--tRNA-(uracil(54)-C(5))-methyltransferase (FADH(2)-oxidizing) TrmFO [Thermodesulfobacterium commune]
MSEVWVVGGGLAGSEAAWQLAVRGVKVVLFEMRPTKLTPAHKTDLLAELVCSNSLRSKELTKAVGLLKEELRLLKSLILESALISEVPSGKALAVDRKLFSEYITQKLSSHPNIKIIREELTEIPKDRIVILATGPLTSEAMAKALATLIEVPYLHFYDAISPVVYAETIDWDKVFVADRYGKEEGSYVNCPLTKEEYERFWEALIKAEKVPLHSFEDPKYFEGCLPIEVMAERGKETLLYGPMKPVGLVDPRTGKQPYAVVQLRPENREKTLYNMVGFQTKLKYEEQKRVFRLIPGLEQAEFARLGSIHRNTFVNAPLVLTSTLQLKKSPNVFLAGQLTGVEGYVESTAMGFLAGINAERLMKGKPLLVPPKETAIGALVHYLVEANPKYFQPMNINWGLFPQLDKKVHKNQKYQLMVERALKALSEWISKNQVL